MEHETNNEQKQQEYEAEDAYYWEMLRKELEQIKEDLESSNVELAEGLGISRQSLILFLKGDNKGLPIYRSNLFKLWNFLTEPKKDKKIKEEAIKKREQLRKAGPEKILRTAGFLTTGKHSHSSAEFSKYELIDSIANRLNNSKINDRSKFSVLRNYIENKIAEIVSAQDKGDYQNFNQEDENWLDKWIAETIDQPQYDVLDKFKRVIEQYKSLGKTEFLSRELYELYMSISENQIFFRDIDDSLKIKITDCDFTTLTFEIQKYINRLAKPEMRDSLNDKIGKIQSKADEYLGQCIKSSPVVKASINSYFKESGKYIKWNFISSATHIHNILAAVEYGMGYCSLIEINDFYIKALERKFHSLTKIEVGFSEIKDPSKIYRGCWVDYNSILGMLQAVVNAVTKWLSSQLITDGHRQKYCDICQKIAEIQYESSLVLILLDEYYLLEDAIVKSEYIISNIEQITNQMTKESLKEDVSAFDYFRTYLEQKIYETKLVLVHAALMQGNLNKATPYLYSSTNYYENKKYDPVFVLYTSADITYNFLSGKKSFLNEKKWRTQLGNVKEKLRNYITTGFIGDESYNGYIDIYEYRSASEFFGNIGLIDFYLSTNNNRKYLEVEAIDNLLIAAYYASKIGQKHRTSHWLLMTSRVYCRLNRKDEAKAYIEIAESILDETSVVDEAIKKQDETIEKKYSATYKKSLRVEIELANGELFLLEGNHNEALLHFLSSLKGAIDIGFPLLIADNLYNIYRSAIKLSKNVSFSKEIQKIFPENELRQLLNQNEKKQDETKIVVDVINLLMDKSKQLNIENFKQKAQDIWNNWFNKSPFHENPIAKDEQHVVAEMMESASFLERMPEN
ncbi:MAG: hypothetical protein WBA39_34660 [Rivularia sp. (in: cyanobacteria)]